MVSKKCTQKLVLKKETIANLAVNEMSRLKAGLAQDSNGYTCHSLCPHETCPAENEGFLER